MLSKRTQINASASDIGIKGIWRNQIGSTLCIQKVIGGKVIKGYYISPLGTVGEIFPISGSISRGIEASDLRISFSVNWGKYQSITSWVGYCELKDGRLQLKTHWQLVKSKPNKQGVKVFRNQDVFTRISFGFNQSKRLNNENLLFKT